MSKTKLRTNKSITLAMVGASCAAMVTASNAFGVTADKAAMQALLLCAAPALDAEGGQIREHNGNTEGCKAVYEALGSTGKINGPSRQRAYMAWLKAFTPVRRNNSTGNFGLIKQSAPNYVPFDIDGAEAVSFLDFKANNSRVPTKSNERIAKSIANMLSKEYENWEGPTLSTEAIMAHVKRILTEEAPEKTTSKACMAALSAVTPDEAGEPNF